MSHVGRATPARWKGGMRRAGDRIGPGIEGALALLVRGRGTLRCIPALLLAIVPIAVTSCAPVSTQTRFGPVPAGHLFEGPVLDIRAPDSDGWQLAGSSAQGVEFARQGNPKNRTFGAQVLIMPWRGDRSPERFMAQIREALEFDWRLDRYENVEKEFAHSDRRNYPCVEVRSLTKDKLAPTAARRSG